MRLSVVTVEFERLQINSGDKILDIGCGTGRHTSAAYRLHGISIVGTDPCFEDLIQADKRLKLHDRLGEHGGGVWCLAAGDILRLPYKNGRFDLVICSEVLEHIENYLEALDEIVRVLKPGCNLVISVPRYWPERVCWALSSAYATTEGGHVRIFKLAQLIKDLQKAGFKPWADHYAHSLHTPYWWLKCIVGPAREDFWPVNLYHRFLTWDMMRRPILTGLLDRLLNPILGKSAVLYLKKER